MSPMWCLYEEKPNTLPDPIKVRHETILFRFYTYYFEITIHGCIIINYNLITLNNIIYFYLTLLNFIATKYWHQVLDYRVNTIHIP